MKMRRRFNSIPYKSSRLPLNKRLYSTNAINTTNLPHNWVTGFSDGESSFSVSISKNSKYKTGWSVIPAYAIELKDKDITLLQEIQKYFGVGKVQSIKNKGHAVYVVNSIKDLYNVIIPHFDKYPLLTVKRESFILFKQIVFLMHDKKHLTEEGLQEIMSIRVLMNNKTPILSYTGPLKEITPVNLPMLNTTNITPEWLTGFTDAEGCFFLNIRSNRNNTGYWVTAGFSLVQHSRDLLLFKLIKEYLGYGNFIEENNREVVRIKVENFKLITEQVIPFFVNNPLQSSKLLEFTDFCRACDLIKEKAHLTEEGITKLKEIKSGMNTGRKH
uniref:Homing endonuclease LAGLIDADG domain-containing protein n=1 Tax=Calonectria ilicicola TaxID=182845 RepID=A0A6G7MXN1_9HYPO|nr:hypothetical protein [Calonectria ilicicola]QIJ45956.1 hypothetical protein [Calonectria ilicicola]